MEREVNQINVIPLVDVMLVLLVIVLTTATFISTGQIPVNLAKAKEAGDHKDVPVVVMLAHPRESLVVVRADKVTLLERFVSVVDEIRGLGFQSVSLEVVRL